MDRKSKNTIPVYDICSLASVRQLQEEIIAEGFARYLSRHSPDLHFAHRHSFFHLVYFTKGGGTHTIDFETFAVTSGQIYFMVPGQVHTWNFEGEVDGYIINFSEQVMHSFLREGRSLSQFPFFSGMAGDGVVQLTAARARVEAILKAIISETGSAELYSKELVAIDLMALFIYVARDVMPGKTRPDIRQNQLILQQFKKLVEQHFNHMRLPKDYAAMLYITPNHLNALCHDVLGKPAGEMIRDRVLLEAKRLLVSSGLGVAEIAYQLDFKDNSYFTKFFKKYASVTPEEFRNSGISKK